MRRLIELSVLLLFIAACQPPAEQQVRFTTDSPEITKGKAIMDAYLSGDWETMRAGFADNAKIYHNSTSHVGPDENVENLQEGLSNVSSYELGDEVFWEMVVDDNGDKWVYFWGEWKAVHAQTGNSMSVPFHLASQYVDGLVVEEHGFWNNGVMMAEAQAAAAEEASAEEEM